MRYLIDGYNLMHAKGLLGPHFGPQGLRHQRERFLDAVVDALGPIDAARSTVVFDAAHPPPGRPARASHQGINVLYAVGDENADARIEDLLEHEPNPEKLTVVSSDRRVRLAAMRRRAKVMDSDAFWTAAPFERRPKPAPKLSRPDRSTPIVNPHETQHWLAIFAEADQEARSNDFPGNAAGFLPSEDELRRIAREVEAEDPEW